MTTHLSVIPEDCIGCGLCVEVCPATPTVFRMEDIIAAVSHPEACEFCMLCTDNCPTDAIILTRTDEVTFDPGDI